MSKRVIISGGGTGGHIFPAIAIANALREREPGIEILFVGAEGRMEMEKVPAAGYQIIGLPVAGFQRRLTAQNISFFFKLASSLLKARKIVADFRPQVAVGVGGYASGPVLRMASWRGVPILLQEQNSYAGVTNRLLGKKAARVCVAYHGMERFFAAEKLVLTGNPVRQDILKPIAKADALQQLGLDPQRKTLLIVGGSLGARTINRAIAAHLGQLAQSGIQVLWQTGKLYFDEMKAAKDAANAPYVHAQAFLSRMDLAYAAADVVISRAGASTISELCLVGKPSILVPSPNVAEDHQTKNAMALVEKGAAIYVSDADAPQKLVDAALSLIQNSAQCQSLAQRITQLAFEHSAQKIADEVFKLIK